MSKSLEKEVVFLRQKTINLQTSNSQLATNLQVAEEKITAAEKKITAAEEKIAHITEEHERVLQAYLQLQRDRFGKKSERFVDADNEQLSLIDAAELPTEDPSEPEDLEPVTFMRKKRGKPDLSKLPTRDVIIAASEADKICSCGCQKELIGHETSQRIHHQPMVIELLNEKREKWACRKGCDGSVSTAALPPRILPKCKATESLLAYIAISKVLDRQPLYHLEKSIEQRYHWRIPRQTMARWLIQLAERLQPLINLMKDRLIEYDVAAIDATSFQVLNEPGRAAGTKSCAYCIRGGPPGKEVILYEYNAYSQKDYVMETLLDFKGVLHCDASPVFNGIGSQEGVTLSYCNAHARRKFEQIEKTDKKSKHPLAKQAMNFYHSLYKIEREATEKQFTPDERYQLRQTKSQPVMVQFKQWLDAMSLKTLPKSPIGQAIAYARNHWAGLTTYLTDGRLQIDNNATERDIKPFVIARKNFMFACTMAGADTLGVHFSLILTARHHGLDPYAYYETILKRVPLCKTLADFEALLPWNGSSYTPQAQSEAKKAKSVATNI